MRAPATPAYHISGMPKYELYRSPIPRGYQLLLPTFLSRGKERSEKERRECNESRGDNSCTLLPWLIGTKHFPNPKLFPESKKTSQNPKHFPESKTRPKIQVFWILGRVFGFWDVFWILGNVLGFYEPSYTTSLIT